MGVVIRIQHIVGGPNKKGHGEHKTTESMQ